MSSMIQLPTPTPVERMFHRHSNSAGGPLPGIPRRGSSSRMSNQHIATLQGLFDREASISFASATPQRSSTPTATLVIEPPTPQQASPAKKAATAVPSLSTATSTFTSRGSSSSSSSGSEDAYVPIILPRAKRVRGQKQFSSLRPPELSTPVPLVSRAKSAPEQVAWPLQTTPTVDSPARGGLKLYLDMASSSSSTPSPPPASGSSSAPATSTAGTQRAASVSLPASVAAQLGRKKSGEPLKSSLKSRRPALRGDLSVITGAAATRSEPSTPTQLKSVHFDAKLEHVKLFLAEQKPLAVSRDGSPTLDTSGTDSDFPTFIFGEERSGSRDKTKLEMRVTNMPKEVDTSADVALEEWTLSQDGSAAHGTIRVRNLAFEKWVAVRFTLDWWQTTSEVTAKYISSLSDGSADRFSFTIRLADLLSRIEEKTLFLAVRYVVAGREIWDNNRGENYQAKFSRVKVNSTPDAGIADLQDKLERVVKGQETVGGYMARKPSPSSSSATPSPRREHFALSSDKSFNSRYDLSTSLKSPWKPAYSHSRTTTYPTSPASKRPPFSTPTNRAAVPDPRSLTRGSPHVLDADDDEEPRIPLFSGSELEDTPMPASRRKPRNHQRGYFDLSFGPSIDVRKIQSGIAGDSPSPGTRYNSFPPTRGERAAVPQREDATEFAKKANEGWAVLERGGSEESTPSVTSNSESSRSSSPSSSPVDDPLMLQLLSTPQQTGRTDTSNYHVFLNKFCFYTGPDSLLGVQTDPLQRSHSASSVEALLSSPVRSTSYSNSPVMTPTRSPSFDDVMSASGSTTPTARSRLVFESPTPVPFAH
ncbi:carbohydrate-binding module family 21 protein [Gelatoporia subvermispora B]|uniref:Carbohydrate-binding module family 21 protein n=1 Tax=Ceriporiopsis subvermispora (strain B) TaxID=914234 RepID=M2R7F5_CERS8|nr:carbohydrate-binding module family 21 protein [Gelatoporia subvermispora B]